MKKYEAPIAELELFAVENIMAEYPGGSTEEDDLNEGAGPNDLPIS